MNYKSRLKDITTFIFDFDGVLSDGNIWYVDDNTQVRATNTRDGYALHHAVKQGYNVAIISGGKGDSIRLRMQALGVKDLFLDCGHKLEVFHRYCEEKNIRPEQVLYMGDDIPDYEIMQEVGIAACPSDACQEIKSIAHYVSIYPGGHGCVRELIEQVMKVKGQWMQACAFHW